MSIIKRTPRSALCPRVGQSAIFCYWRHDSLKIGKADALIPNTPQQSAQEGVRAPITAFLSGSCVYWTSGLRRGAQALKSVQDIQMQGVNILLWSGAFSPYPRLSPAKTAGKRDLAAFSCSCRISLFRRLPVKTECPEQVLRCPVETTFSSKPWDVASLPWPSPHRLSP